MVKQQSRLIDIDKNIKPIIVKLNKKGYFTRFCCESHAEETGRKNIYTCMYINFHNEIPKELQNLKLFLFDKDNKTLRYFIKSKEKKEIIQEKNKCLKELDDWVNNLPVNQQ